MKNRTKFFILDILDIKKNNWELSNINTGNRNDSSSNSNNNSFNSKKGGSNSDTSFCKSQSTNITLTIVEKNLNETFNDNTRNISMDSDDNATINNQSFLSEIINNLETDIEFYKCFRLSDDKSVIFLSFNLEFILLIL